MAIAGFFAVRAESRGPSDADVGSTASSVAAVITARLETDGRLLAAVSSAIDGDPSLPAAQLQARIRGLAPTDRTVAVAALGASRLAAVIPNDSIFPTGDFFASDQWPVVLDLARDRAGAGAFVGAGADGSMTVFDVFPLYGTLDVPVDIGARRAQIKGYVITATPSATITRRPSTLPTEMSVRVTDGPTVLTTQGAGTEVPPSDATSAGVSANGVAWTVQAWANDPASSVPWLVLAGGFLLALVVGAIVWSRERSIAAALAETEARNQELGLIARTGPLLQQSLALGDLLPVFVVEVGDELGLDGISINLCTETGEMVRAFSLGAGSNLPVTSVESIKNAPATAAAGEVVTVPLVRLGRVVGSFQGRSVKGLGEPQMETLRAVCALLAAAVGNVRLFQEEQDMVVRLRELDQMKTQFIGSVSHELRTSVTAIQGFAGLLETGASTIEPEKRADYAQRIGRNSRSLSLLIEDLLDFARFERSGLAAELRPIDLSELVPTVVDQMSSVVGGRTVTTAIEPGVIAMADTLAVERVLANLLSNAGKYTPEDSEITVALERNGTNAELFVCDHGPGVPPDEREKIFDLFYRSDASARVTRGVGIGLALVRQLVGHLNGTIAVDDAPGGGARFRVTIPLAPDEHASPSLPVTESTRLRTGG